MKPEPETWTPLGAAAQQVVDRIEREREVAEEVRKKLGLSRAQWDAIPNAGAA